MCNLYKQDSALSTKHCCLDHFLTEKSKISVHSHRLPNVRMFQRVLSVALMLHYTFKAKAMPILRLFQLLID